MMRFLHLFFIAILLFSCKESERERIACLISEWNGKTVRFPDDMRLVSYRNDTIIEYTRIPSSYTILNYVDTIGCVSCRLQLPRWKEMMEELDSIYPNKVNCLMVFYPKSKRKLIKHLRNNQFDHFVYIDEMDSLNKMNNFLHDEHFCTFLLDKDDKIVAIGNPVFKPKVKELYLNIISGKTVLPLVGKQSLTVASFFKDKVDLGSFSWYEAQEIKFVVSNTGKVPLVINDVITSCGCTTVEYSKEPVQTGKNLVLKARYRADHPEYFNKTITVYCNAEGSPFQLQISGNAK